MRYILLMVTWSLGSPAVSQQILAEVDAAFDKQTKDVVFIPVGDSIFFSYKQKNASVTVAMPMWISSEGVVRRTTHIKDFFKILPFDEVLYYYYFDDEANSLGAYVGNSSGLMESKDKVEITGEILGEFERNGLNFVLYEKKSTKIKVVTIQGMQIVASKEFDVPENLEEVLKKNSGAEFINEDSPVSSFNGISKLRVYKSKEYLYVVYDRSIDGSRNNEVYILRLHPETGDSQTFTVPISFRKEFRSFLFDERLYAYSPSSKKAMLGVFDLKGNVIGTYISVVPGYPDFKIYCRYGRDMFTSKDEGLHGNLRSTAFTSPTISTFRDSAGIIIQTGTYYNEKGTVGAGAFSSNPVAGLLTMVVGTAIRQAITENPGVCCYFYYESDGNTGFTINPNSSNVRQRLDDYEAQKLRFFEYRGYYAFKSGILAIYKFRNNKKISLVYFK